MKVRGEKEKGKTKSKREVMQPIDRRRSLGAITERSSAVQVMMFVINTYSSGPSLISCDPSRKCP